MRRLLTIVLVAILAGGCGSVELAQTGITSSPSATSKPNIVLLLTDDLSMRLLSQNLEAYPHIRALQSNGVTFGRAIVTEPVCCPSRATSLTGLYSHNHHIKQTVDSAEGAFRETLEDKALPLWMSQAGYTNGYFGKYLNGYKGDHRPPGWDVWKPITFSGKIEVGSNVVSGFDEAGRDKSGRTHTQVYTDRAVSFIKTTDKPFFAYMAPYAPHKPAAYPAAYERLFADARVPRVPSYDEPDVSDKPEWVRSKRHLSATTEGEIDELWRKMARSTKDIDRAVGRIVAALRDSGELSNTYIFFTSDNGFHMGEHRLEPMKWSAYDEDSRVPLIVRGPSVPQGAIRGQLVANTDLAPTFADVAGAQPMLEVDGRSILPLLSENPPSAVAGTWRDALLIEAIANTLDDRPAYEAVRTRHAVYVEYKTGEKELYDLEADPYQLENLARTMPDVQAQLSSRLDALKTCSADSCRNAEGP